MFSFRLGRIPHLRQWLAALQLFVGMFVIGTNIGWTAPFMGRLIAPAPPFAASAEQISWVASLNNLLRPAGTLLGGLSYARAGAQRTLLLTAPALSAAAALALLAAARVQHVYAAQALTGAAAGAYYGVFPLFVAEVADARVRGALNNLVMQGFLLGVVAGNLAGAYLPPWQYGAAVLALLALYGAAFALFPQTPQWHVRRGRPARAEAALRWYRPEADAAAEVRALAAFLAARPPLPATRLLRALLAGPVRRRVAAILAFTYGFSQLCGIFTIMEYSNIIFVHGGVTAVDPALLVTAMGATGIPGCWVAMYATDRFGRATMLGVSCVMYAASVLMLALNFQLLDLGYAEPWMQALVVAAGLLFRVSTGVGIMCVPMILASELLAPDVKNAGSCLCNVLAALCSFLSNKLFQLMVDALTYKHVFYLIAALTLALAVFSFTCVPETKGLTMEEIQDMLQERYGAAGATTRTAGATTRTAGATTRTTGATPAAPAAADA